MPAMPPTSAVIDLSERVPEPKAPPKSRPSHPKGARRAATPVEPAFPPNPPANPTLPSLEACEIAVGECFQTFLGGGAALPSNSSASIEKMVSSLANAVWERLQPKLVELQFMSEVQHSVPVAPDLTAWNTRHPEKSEPYKAEQEQIDQEAEEEEEEEYDEEVLPIRDPVMQPGRDSHAVYSVVLFI